MMKLRSAQHQPSNQQFRFKTNNFQPSTITTNHAYLFHETRILHRSVVTIQCCKHSDQIFKRKTIQNGRVALSLRQLENTMSHIIANFKHERKQLLTEMCCSRASHVRHDGANQDQTCIESSARTRCKNLCTSRVTKNNYYKPVRTRSQHNRAKENNSQKTKKQPKILVSTCNYYKFL